MTEESGLKIVISIGLETEGDYSLRNSANYEMTFDGSAYFHRYEFADTSPKYTWESDYDAKREPTYRAATLLEQMLCDIHVVYTHHYILDDIFHMFDDALSALGRRENYFESSVSGNYDGTYIEISIVEEKSDVR